MGEIVKVSCSVCRKEWQFMIGCGLQHGRKENIVTAFQEQERAEVAGWLDKSSIPLYDFKYQITSCSFCNNLVSVPVLRGMDDDEIFVGVCPSCGEQTEMPLQENIPDISCPVCGAKALTTEETGHWD